MVKSSLKKSALPNGTRRFKFVQMKSLGAQMAMP